MSKTTRFGIALAVAILFVGSVGFAQSGGEATYKAKCQMCHGMQGIPNPGIAKNMGVKPATDPEVKAHTAGQMFAITADGKGKMPAFKGKLTDAEMKGAVDYFRAFAK